jgi:hypothetical protein
VTREELVLTMLMVLPVVRVESSLVKDMGNNNLLLMHCHIHRKNLAPKEMTYVLKTNALNTRLLQAFCDEVACNHQTLYHAEIPWLFHGKIFKRSYKLQMEFAFILIDKKNYLSHYFHGKIWVARLAYFLT